MVRNITEGDIKRIRIFAQYVDKNFDMLMAEEDPIVDIFMAWLAANAQYSDDEKLIEAINCAILNTYEKGNYDVII